MYKTELYHHGVKGQKWGVRRYQNKDGTLTALGKRVRNSEWNQPTVKQGKGKPNSTPAQVATRHASSVVNNSKQLNSSVQRLASRKSTTHDYSNLTDTEIRNRVNRLNLERQLAQLESGNKRSGYDYVSDILDVTGSVVGIAGGIAGVMALLNATKAGN